MLRIIHMVRFIILSQLFLLTLLSGQDSLHLVATLVGENTDNPIEDAKGIGDMNGDGYDDIAVSFKNYCNIYFGGDPFDLVPDIKFGNGFFQVPGDVNNDKYADIIIGHHEYAGSYYFNLYFGGEEVDVIPDFTYIASNYGDDIFSNRVREIGDVNNDGYNDFIISCYYNWYDGKGRVYLFYGGEAIKENPDITFTSKSQDIFYGKVVSGIGDANFDGYDDIMITSDVLNTQEYSIVYLYYGSSEMDTTADRIFMPMYDEPLFGCIISNSGNLNGDLFNNFIISSLAFTYIYLNLDSVIIISHQQFERGSTTVAEGGGDINNDGFDDFIIGSETYKNNNNSPVGAAFVFYGNTLLDTIYDLKIEGDNPWGYFSIPSSIIGDINNDGYDDVLILEKQYPDNQNILGKLYIYSHKNITINNIETNNNYIPSEYSFLQIYPNPFNNMITIRFYLQEDSHICLSIYNYLGGKISTLEKRDYYRGNYQVQWNGTDIHSQAVASGIYFIELRVMPKNKCKSYNEVKKVVLIK